jgi:hypothetical protein
MDGVLVSCPIVLEVLCPIVLEVLCPIFVVLCASVV